MKFRWLWLCGLLLTFVAQGAEKVRVGVYDFPPFAFVGNTVKGVIPEMVAAMNDFQQQYEFVIVPTTAKRRYKDFDGNLFDMLLFESKGWGWVQKPVSTSMPFLKGAEVYVALKAKGRNQSFFSDFKQKSLIAVLGYHYGFARFHNEQDYLQKHFNIVLTDTQEKSLEALFRKRGEIAVMSRDYLNYYFSKHPKDRARVLISDKLDQVYRHTALVRNGLKHINVRDINRLLAEMKRKGTLLPLWQKYGLSD